MIIICCVDVFRLCVVVESVIVVLKYVYSIFCLRFCTARSSRITNCLLRYYFTLS